MNRGSVRSASGIVPPPDYVAPTKIERPLPPPKAVARFGRLQWSAAGRVKIETRSGNTAKPGVGWSDWIAPSGAGRMGGGLEGGKIQSPPGRYLQWRVALEDDQARVRRVKSYYVPQNQPTQVQEVTVEPATKESGPTLKDSAGKPRSPLVKLKWKVENPDSDDTQYTLEARRDGEANWRPIATGKAPLTATSWEWNTETYPDGWYRARVTASDAAANSPDRALTTSAQTTQFAIRGLGIWRKRSRGLTSRLNRF